jgi:glycosyltransferase domain-containing protein
VHLNQQYTLVVPTYNRPQLFGQLLRYLSRRQAQFRIVVLDSGKDDTRQANRAAVKAAGLDIRYLEFDSSIPPFEKFWRGAQAVATPYASFCADDDLPLVESFDPIVRHLAATPGCAVAHGWYFTFRMGEAFELTGMLYRGASIVDHGPLERLYWLMRNYEAMTYGVYRTEVLQDVLSRVQCVQTNMARELLGSALAVVAGAAQRLPLIYQGRSMEPSMYVADWHPIDYLISSPERLFREYAMYREAIHQKLVAQSPGSANEDVLTAIDQIHWRYISDYFKPSVLDYVYEQLRAGASRQQIMDGMWGLLLAAEEPPIKVSTAFGRSLRNFVVAARARLGIPAARRSPPATRTITRAGRTYRTHPAFKEAVASSRELRYDLTTLLGALDAYA